ncbi:GntR family transcriptional regulator [Brevibacterium marinum]|uniref:DNA-binding GntR family transcriptional regulator n=1 Tax=Brevibacterium marinum TaxID=418643 RepID=A0A846S4F2_9MICO|nr:DNA-binding GntR family transcriptional regulator [Brevibacterium marinum]
METDRRPVTSLREQALGIIRDAITAGELDEERIYSAAGLAKQLGMSLSPVREAMMSLVTEGTVEAVPNRGFRLVPVTWSDLEEITRVRVLLAVPAVRQLCDRAAGHVGSESAEPADPVADGSSGASEGASGAPDGAEAADEPLRIQLEQLREHAAATAIAAEAGDATGFFTHDRRFHEALLEYGLGRRAADISLRLRDQSRVFRPQGAVDEVNTTSARELSAIVDLIEQGRADEVTELVTRNLYFFKRTAPVPDES